MRTNIVLEPDLVERAMRFGEAHTKRELVRIALQEYVDRREAQDLRHLYGAGGISENYDYKALRAADNKKS